MGFFDFEVKPNSTYGQMGALYRNPTPSKDDAVNAVNELALGDPRTSQNMNTNDQRALAIQTQEKIKNLPQEPDVVIGDGALMSAYARFDDTPPVADTPQDTVQTPDADPAGALAGMNRNLMMGVGSSLGVTKPPEPPKPGTMIQKEMDMQAKQTMFDMNKIPVWYESDAFSSGLLSFGFNLLAGNDIATAFNAAGEVFDKGFSKEKRQAWANDLVEQGYDAHDIQRWIETGDNKDLTDPMEKKMKMMNYQTQAAQLDDLLYRTSPAMREYEMGRQQWQDQMAMDNQAWDRNMQAQRLGMDRLEHGLRVQEHKRKLAADEAKANKAGKPDPKMMMSGALMASTDQAAVNYIPTTWDYTKLAAIEKLPERARESAMQQYIPEFHAYNQARNQMSEMIGRGLSGAALSETKERPTWANALMPTQAEIEKNDTVAMKRKENVRNALIAYASTVAEGSQGSLGLQDITMMANGSAQMMVDEYGVPRAIRYRNGSMKNL